MLEPSIHQILSEATLPAELPIDRIVTGDIQGESFQLPYATIELTENKSAIRSNQSTIERAMVSLTVWDDQHQRGTTLREAIVTIFDNQHFTTDTAHILSCRKHSDSAKKLSGGIWQIAIEFQFLFEQILP